MFSTGIKLLPEQWDGKMVVKHPEMKSLNSALRIIVGNVERALIDLSNAGRFDGKKASEIVAILQEELDPMAAQTRKDAQTRRYLQANGLFACFRRYVELKKNEGTRRLYQATYNKLRAYCDENQINMLSLALDDVKPSFLISFEQFCLKTQRQNTASRHLRDIRAVFNAAIDDGLTSNYPFRKFKIKQEISEDKSYTAEELRRLFEFKSKVRGEREAIDVFKLMFCFIGINSVDLANCEPAMKGRIKYIRKKTGKPYNIKVEPEAAEIIRKYGGNTHLINILEKCTNYKTYFHRLGQNLKKVGKQPVPGKKSIGEAILPDICTGSARTSWATIAQEELDMPREVIAAALGHSTVDVTTTYLRTEWRKKVDEANRKVLDWVIYGKK
jgi:integrase